MLRSAQPLVTRQKAIRALAETQKELRGSLLINYVLAMRLGGEARITQVELVNATGGKLQTSHAQNGEWVVTAVPDPTSAIMTQEEMDRYTAMVAREEAKAKNGAPCGEDTAALEGDNVVDSAG